MWIHPEKWDWGCVIGQVQHPSTDYFRSVSCNRSDPLTLQTKLFFMTGAFLARMQARNIQLEQSLLLNFTDDEMQDPGEGAGTSRCLPLCAFPLAAASGSMSVAARLCCSCCQDSASLCRSTARRKWLRHLHIGAGHQKPGIHLRSVCPASDRRQCNGDSPLPHLPLLFMAMADKSCFTVQTVLVPPLLLGM